MVERHTEKVVEDEGLCLENAALTLNFQICLPFTSCDRSQFSNGEPAAPIDPGQWPVWPIAPTQLTEEISASSILI